MLLPSVYIILLCIAQKNFYALLENEPGAKESDKVRYSASTNPELSHQTGSDHYQETTSQSSSPPSGIIIEDVYII